MNFIEFSWLGSIVIEDRCFRSGMVNAKSFVGKDLLQIKWKYILTVHFKHKIIGK